MNTTVNVSYIDGMAFEAEVNGHTILFDADPAVGGEDRGPRPKASLLASLGGCTGMDVVAMLRKMRVEFDGFEMKIEGELSGEHPKIYTSIRLTYIFYGKDIPMDKVEKAVNLSQEKYCGVSAMLKGVSKIEHIIELKEKP